MNLKICPHDFTIEIPNFARLNSNDRRHCMHYCKCTCLMTGWWTRIHIEGYYREDYPTYRCQDCGRVAVIDSFHCSPKEHKIGDAI